MNSNFYVCLTCGSVNNYKEIKKNNDANDYTKYNALILCCKSKIISDTSAKKTF